MTATTKVGRTAAVSLVAALGLENQTHSIMMVAIFLLALATSINAFAGADRWVVIGDSSDGGVISVDRQSFKKGAFPEFWTTNSSVDCPVGDSAMRCSAKVKMKANCKTGEYAILRGVFYDQGGDIALDHEQSTVEFKEPTPESTAEMIVRYVCRR